MVGTFPLNVQAGSPQYTLTTQISPTSSTTSFSVSGTDAIAPISNAYYTIQNADGSKWCTFYVGQWTTDSTNNYTGTCTYSSSNTSDVFPEGSICWCVWTKEYYESLTTYISNINIGIPAGCIVPYAGITIPSGWLLCDGSTLNRKDYPELFSAILNIYGGSGSTFKLPNLSGKFPLGRSVHHALAKTGGSETVTLTTEQMPSHGHGSTLTINSAGEHTHNIVHADGPRGYTDAINTTAVVTPDSLSGLTNTSGSHTHSGYVSIYSSGSGQAHSNMPPYITLSYIIKT